jgi:hypothetical protein
MASVGAGVLVIRSIGDLPYLYLGVEKDVRNLSGYGLFREVSFLELITAFQVPSGSSLLAEIYSDIQKAFPY